MDNSCPICLEDINDIQTEKIPPNCHCKVKYHIICYNTMVNMRKMSCAFCRCRNLQEKKNSISEYTDFILTINDMLVNMFNNRPNWYTFLILLLGNIFMTITFILPLVIVKMLKDIFAHLYTKFKNCVYKSLFCKLYLVLVEILFCINIYNNIIYMLNPVYMLFLIYISNSIYNL
jgi:hypothetical protein